MKLFRFAVLTTLCALLLSYCAQSSNSSLRDEVGANGLPTPRALFARYVNAIGGETTIRSHRSTSSRGRFMLPSFGIEGSTDSYAAAPNHVTQIIELSGVGRIESGYNGELGWSVDPIQGNSILEGEQLAYLVQQADYYLPLNLATIFPDSETVAIAQVNGTDSYRVNLRDRSGRASTYYFGTGSSLLLRTETTAASPIGNVEVITTFGNYQDFQGYRLPTTIELNQAGQEFTIQITNVTFDDVSPDRFVPPAVIRALTR